jgi:hypothetical protein
VTIEPNHTVERLRFRERYGSLTDDDLAHVAMDENLLPAAREAIAEEVDARGLRDHLSSLRNRLEEEARALPKERNDHQLFGLIALVMFGLVGVHKWLLGDATTWRKEGVLALWLFWALIFTWDPTVRLVKGQGSGKLVFWLVLGWSYFAAIVAALAIPPLGRVVSDVNPLLAVAIVASPAIVVGAQRLVRRFASRSR